MFPFGEQFGQKVGQTQQFQVLYLPPLCDPPIGLVWPATMGRQAIADTLDDMPSFKYFLEVLTEVAPMVDEWFSAVNDNVAPFTTHMYDANPLSAAIPTDEDPDPTALTSTEEAEPLLDMVEIILWTIHIDYLRTKPMSSIERTTHVLTYLQNAKDCYPDGVYKTAPIGQRPYMGYFARPHNGWLTETTNWTRLFCHEVRVSAWAREFDTIEVPIRPTEATTWVATPMKSRTQLASETHAQATPNPPVRQNSNLVPPSGSPYSPNPGQGYVASPLRENLGQPQFPDQHQLQGLSVYLLTLLPVVDLLQYVRVLTYRYSF